MIILKKIVLMQIMSLSFIFQYSLIRGVEFGPINPGKKFRKCLFPDPGIFVVLNFQRPTLFPCPGKKLYLFQHVFFGVEHSTSN